MPIRWTIYVKIAQLNVNPRGLLYPARDVKVAPVNSDTANNSMQRKHVKTVLSRISGIALAIVALAVASPAYATFLSGGSGPVLFPGPVTPPAKAPHILDHLGYPGDSVQLLGLIGGSLTTGTHLLNTVDWNVSYTYAGAGDPVHPDAGWQELTFNFTATRDLTIGTETKQITQNGSLLVGWENDFLTFSDGPTVTFGGSGFAYQVDVTPLGLAQTGASLFLGDPAWHQPLMQLNANFDVTGAVPDYSGTAGVPEPSQVAMSLMAMLGVGGFVLRQKFSRKAAK